jgi:mitogen-activated protein kinase kinase kinase 9
LSYEINYNELSFEKKIAEGSFGIIYKGKWRGTTVAIKELKAEFLQEKSIIDFLSKTN